MPVDAFVVGTKPALPRPQLTLDEARTSHDDRRVHNRVATRLQHVTGLTIHTANTGNSLQDVATQHARPNFNLQPNRNQPVNCVPPVNSLKRQPEVQNQRETRREAGG
jgi:hypothetical protein